MNLPDVSLDTAPCRAHGTALAPARPVQPSALAQPGEPADAPPPAPATPAGVPSVELDGTCLAPGQRALLALRHWAHQWWAAAGKAAKNPRGPYHAQPESLAMHDAYRRSRAWVPPGQDGKLLGPAGDAYHLTFARFGLVTGYGWAWVWARPLRLFLAAATVATVVLTFLFA